MKIFRVIQIWLVISLLLVFLIACQGSTPTVLPTESPTATPFVLPPTWTPTVTVPPSPTMTPAPVLPSATPTIPASEWRIPPLSLPTGVHDVLIYDENGTDVYTILLDGGGDPLGEGTFWYSGPVLKHGLFISPDGRFLAEWVVNETDDYAYFFDPLIGTATLRDVSAWDNFLVRGYLGWAGDSNGILHSSVNSIVLIDQHDGRLLVDTQADYRRAYGATISPDGRYLVYSFQGSWSEPHPPGTWILDLETQITEKMLDYAITTPVWSPDGQWIAFMAYADEINLPNYPVSGSLWMLMRPDGSDMQIVHEYAAGDFPVWSPNGDGLAFVTSGTGNPPEDMYFIYKNNAFVADVSVAGVSHVRPVMPDSEYGYIDPSWSPDGNALLVVGDSKENSDIWLVSRDGETVNQLTFDKGYKRFPIWFRVNLP